MCDYGQQVTDPLKGAYSTLPPTLEYSPPPLVAPHGGVPDTAYLKPT